ncbi:MAG: hypothetical protein PUF71_04365 [Firmicutes bacterium]|nr:hypothetical protein [Bacillota bacterium]
MDAIKSRIRDFLIKYRFVLLVLLLGILLMTLPTGSIKKQSPAVSSPGEPTTEEKLCSILSRIQGVGKVEVMLTTASGAETVYQTDQTGSDNSSRTDTVVITDSGRNQTGLIRQINPPVYLGAVIVCQGGDKPAVKLAVAEAVSRVTGLRSHQIVVLKMK